MQGHVLDKLRELPSDCIDVVVTSPPYWGLRSYGSKCISIWDEKADCVHQWGNEIFTHQRGAVSGETSVCDDHNQKTASKEADNGAFCLKCGAWRGQLGLEPNPQTFIDHLTQVFNEVKRVLKPSGCLWLNLGDTYFGGNLCVGQPKDHKSLSTKNKDEKYNSDDINNFIKERNKLRSNWLQPKQKMLIPERTAIALQEQGWVLRNTVVWHKVTHMPESVRDRLTRSWENVFFFVKNADKYYFDLNAIRKPYPKTTVDRCKRAFVSNVKIYDENFNADKHTQWAKKVSKANVQPNNKNLQGHSGYNDKDGNLLVNVLGANPGDVWSLTTEALKEQHFSAFPQKLVRQCLLPSAPRWICNLCGKARTRITKTNYVVDGGKGNEKAADADDFTYKHSNTSAKYRLGRAYSENQTIGWTDCGCKQGFHAALVFDPFAGAGTTLLVAHKMGYDWLGIELVAKYCEMSLKRIAKVGNVRLDGFLEGND